MNAKTKSSIIAILAIGCLITGNLVGAGILGIPVIAGINGFIPSLVGMVIFGGAMFYSAIILAKESTDTKDDVFNYPSLYQKYLGASGKWVAIIANMIILYGLLTAYLTGGTTIIAKLFNYDTHSHWVLFALFVVMTTFTLRGISFIRRYNVFLIIALWFSFAVIVFMGEKHVQPVRLLATNWTFLPITIPVIVTSFHFHNLIPNISKNLKWDMKAITKAMLIGMVICFIMNAIWIQVGVGVIPLFTNNGLVSCYNNNIPATVPMVMILKSPTFTIFSMLFALLAITTSYVANGLGLLGFSRDLAINDFKINNKYAHAMITFLPPLIISLIYPDVFLKAINIVGGIGIVVLFGILPSILAIIKTKSKSFKLLSYVFLILFSAVFIFEVGEQFGLVNISTPTNPMAVPTLST
jgi:tyrosine-specific transport protein